MLDHRCIIVLCKCWILFFISFSSRILSPVLWGGRGQRGQGVAPTKSGLACTSFWGLIIWCFYWSLHSNSYKKEWDKIKKETLNPPCFTNILLFWLKLHTFWIWVNSLCTICKFWTPIPQFPHEDLVMHSTPILGPFPDHIIFIFLSIQVWEIHVDYFKIFIKNFPLLCVFEPTCAYGTVGSYASLSVRLSHF